MTIIDKFTSESEIVDILLGNRNINPKNMDEFLHPSSPLKFPVSDFGVNQKQLDKAVNRIKKAIELKQNILIYGDYDVDGITATAILWQVLSKNKAKVVPFVPDREIDGYGIKAESFFRFQKQTGTNFDLLITVDNGIVAHQEIKKIINSGVEVIVSDHHLSSGEDHNSIITVHSTSISGSVVSWLISKEIDKTADLGLAALGTVADCLPLNTINRNIVFHGLRSLRDNPNLGIKKIIQISNLNQTTLSTYDLGFIIGPRINAVGRLSNPTDALRLLCASTLPQVTKYAQILNTYNKDRQIIQQENIEIATKQTLNNKNQVLFVADKSFHPGIIGLIASRLTDKNYLPSIAISIGETVSKGSCRSIKELNIIESLREIGSNLVELGGHALAAGFTIETKKIPEFKKNIIKIINQKLKNKKLKPTKLIDAEMKLNAVNIKNCQIVNQIEPFGIENPEPVFLFNNVRVTDIKLLGTNKEHLKIKVDDPKTPINENITIDSIAFKKGDIGKNLKIGDYISFTAKLNINIWNGYTNPQLIVNDILSL